MKIWVDPPSGWKYGFPKIWDNELHPNMESWLVREGYPWGLKESFGQYFYCRQWLAEDDDKQLLNEGK
jgi:hypothetical protein